jgi:hypothetical protein
MEGVRFIRCTDSSGSPGKGIGLMSFDTFGRLAEHPYPGFLEVDGDIRLGLSAVSGSGPFSYISPRSSASRYL